MFEGRLLFSLAEARMGVEYALREFGIALDPEELQALANDAIERSDRIKARGARPHYSDLFGNLVAGKYPNQHDPRRESAQSAIGHMFAERKKRIEREREHAAKRRPKKKDGPVAKIRRIWPQDARGQFLMELEDPLKHGRR